MVMLITPPQAHMHLDVLLNAGAPFIITVGEPGAHGPVMTGMQGWGVSTPLAAAVAVATCGLLRVVHMPKGLMLAIGVKSMMLAASCPDALTGGPLGITVRVEGVVPNVHWHTAFMHVS
jgi:hypothetical protein